MNPIEIENMEYAIDKEARNIHHLAGKLKTSAASDDLMQAAQYANELEQAATSFKEALYALQRAWAQSDDAANDNTTPYDQTGE